MQATEVKCPGCFAPIAPGNTGLTTCRYCGATVSLAAPPRVPPDAPLFLDDAGAEKLEVIKVVRAHTGLGYVDAKRVVEGAPCIIAEWKDSTRLMDFQEALLGAGARVRRVPRGSD